MILPPGHAQTVRIRRGLRTRERWMIGTVLGAVVALAVAIAVALAASGPSSAHGCIHLVLPAATGAQEINQCGANARATCGSIGKPGGVTGAAARAASSECRKAGLDVGP